MASASIAQVHKAVLRTPDGKGVVVAVKVQKPAIEKQMEWDLFSYRYGRSHVTLVFLTWYKVIDVALREAIRHAQ